MGVRIAAAVAEVGLDVLDLAVAAGHRGDQVADLILVLANRVRI